MLKIADEKFSLINYLGYRYGGGGARRNNVQSILKQSDKLNPISKL
jgi:hypothetical protein